MEADFKTGKTNSGKKSSPLPSVTVDNFSGGFALTNEVSTPIKIRFRDAFLLLYSTIFLSLSVVSCSLAVAYTNYIENSDRPNYKPRLHDIIIDHIPEYVETFKVTEYTIIAMGCVFIILLIIHKNRLRVLRRYMLIMASVYALRSICLISTQLSVPHTREICPNIVHYGSLEILRLASTAAFTFGLVNQGMLSCGDYLFSGHTAALCILALFITKYSQKNTLVFLVIWSMTAVGTICIITSFMHYTIDVVIALLVAYVTFTSYHFVVLIHAYSKEFVSQNALLNVWIYKLHRFSRYCNILAFLFEKDCPAFSNEYEAWFENICLKAKFYIATAWCIFCSLFRSNDSSNFSTLRQLV